MSIPTPFARDDLRDEDIDYPDSDGMPMADNTPQFQWIVTLKEGIGVLFRDDPDVFVAGDLLYYPVERRPDIRIAPDVLVTFDAPKGIGAPIDNGRKTALHPRSCLRCARLVIESRR